ncbi:muramoyltetrapeptide carboxypeptidase [Spinactinospora alkalitolerans]|uniref:Muramoyltetrapeptide carboxypeptidase n=1 Tax=Spinactinospora alkalitolerans TaxID=687207 RepID=A0A852TWA5_9ACTN|nr:LD-carboxypeptidase [Spinactinospora alkalitolerans]NYE48796.1 muramoyltetrapeptide carboxypeptidase [Spinactinospora alkalitolerans]
MSAARAPLRPPRLRPGDRVSVVAPCGPVPAGLLDAACDIVRGWGLEPVLAPHVLDRHPTLPHLAGLDAERARDLQEAWLDPGTSAVLCARGGDGAHRTVDLLDFAAMRQAPPKAFVGYSDVTALHEAFAEELGLATLHGPVLATEEFTGDARTAEELRATLFEPESRLKLTSPTARTLVPGTARGVTVGGNLSLLNDGLATPHSRPSAAGAVLLLEDVAEDVSRIDRMLTQLLRTGWMAGVAGIALGSWRRCTPDPEVIRELVLDRLAPLGVPVVWEFGFGHCPSQLTVPLGAMATLDADAATLTLDEPALR